MSRPTGLEASVGADEIEAQAVRCLESTRSMVLNVLVVVGVGIALTGGLLRWKGSAVEVRGQASLGQGLLGGLFVILAASRIALRVMTAPSALRDPVARFARFYRGHVVSAGLGALAIPLGLAYGWLVRAELEAVVPFWVTALALGFMAFPRTRELQDLIERRDEEPYSDEHEHTR
ncbi:MAG: hypothetical protein U0794_09730 [Isosphaeraceae bacterium]